MKKFFNYLLVLGGIALSIYALHVAQEGLKKEAANREIAKNRERDSLALVKNRQLDSLALVAEVDSIAAADSVAREKRVAMYQTGTAEALLLAASDTAYVVLARWMVAVEQPPQLDTTGWNVNRRTIPNLFGEDKVVLDSTPITRPRPPAEPTAWTLKDPATGCLQATATSNGFRVDFDGMPLLIGKQGSLTKVLFGKDFITLPYLSLNNRLVVTSKDRKAKAEFYVAKSGEEDPAADAFCIGDEVHPAPPATTPPATRGGAGH